MSQMRVYVLAAAVGLVLQCDTSWAQRPSRAPAQRQRSGYSPSRPTVSPYLNLLRRDNGAVPNYHTLVRPQVEQQAINQRQQSQIATQQRNLATIEGQIKLNDPSVRSTGSASVYSDHSHYYPSSTAGARPRR